MVASTYLNIRDFQDQLVHPVTLNLAILSEPIQVLSTKFKHQDELSDFSFAIDN
jgi:hypothetical protein